MLNAMWELVSCKRERGYSTLCGNWFQAAHFIAGEKKTSPEGEAVDYFGLL
jgi:hypothetical protein